VSEPLGESLARSPAWFPLELAAPGELRMLQLGEAAYREASFLDQRLLGAAHPRATVPVAQAQAAAAALPRRLHFIFHTGHVGSTLLSRLIGEHEAFFCLREPALLRAAAASRGAEVPPLPVTLALLGRTWRAPQRAVVKVTSFASELAGELLALCEQPVAILIYAQPLAYLRGILAGPNSRTESRALAGGRLARLTRRLGAREWQADPASEGEQVAMSWLSEMLTLSQTAAAHPARVQWLDFDAFLGAPQEHLQSVLRALGADPPLHQITQLVTSPLMRRYSKAPEYAYDAQLRADVLQSADQEHGSEIRRGLAWLQNVALRYPAAGALLEWVARSRAGGAAPR
jgi:hypothetical protein